MNRLRLGWIGCGGIAKTHAVQMAPLAERLQVTAVVDPVAERATAMAAAFPGARTAADHRSVYEDVDAVLLALPHDLHASVATDFLRAGKHVLVEKPMANSEDECWSMIEAARTSDRVLMVAYCMRYHPLVERLQALIRKRAYGEVFQVSIWTEQHTQYPEGHWGLSAERLGGGQFFSHGCHYIDLLLWFLGEPLEGMHLGTRLGTPWMEKEGTSNVMLRFANGALGYHFGTWGARGTKLRYAFHAHTEQGLLELDLHAGELRHHCGQDVRVLLKSDETKPMTRQMAHFLDCVQNRGTPRTDGLSSLEGLRVIWKLYQAEERHGLADLRGEGLGSLAAMARACPAGTR